ncbi:MAG: Unknown protein [uncultured Sulfurovum sp.]|uniref:FIST C-domain domain-containing protein n=1 Tax=uncultured Sulfurovum sp. TaxID=269237 RepID=A0A6S6RYK8_9BACT|nr:MAG: Unknown protein [uncultured Sulfurovum sp.]
MQHKLINSTDVDVLIEEIDKSITKSFTPTLAFIYLSVKYDITYLVRMLDKYDFVIVGSTTSGEVYADDILGVNVRDKTITCMLLDLDKTSFYLKLKEKNKSSHRELGMRMAKWSQKKVNSPTVLTLTSGVEFNNESYIQGLQTKIRHLFGASAGDDQLFQRTHVFSGEKIISNGALVLVFDNAKVDIVSTRSFGWSGIGTQRIVTKSNQNIVYTIDDKPAVEFYKDYLNISSSDMPGIGVNYPMEVVLQNGQTIYRAALHINEDGSLLFAGHVEEHAKVRISAPIGEEIINYVGKGIEDSLAKVENFKADFTLIFPCTAHKNLLGSYAINEIEAVYAKTKEAPLIGFYAYGEIASSRDSNAFHNQTFVTVQLREK